MDFKKVLADSSRALADMAAKAVNKDKKLFNDLMEQCFSDKYPLSMRASRVVQLICEKDPNIIKPFINRMLKKIIKSKIDGVKRNFLKIFAEYIDLKSIDDLGLLVNTCFDYLKNTKESVAVRYYSMEILHKIIRFEPDLKNEYIAVLESLMEESSKGIKNRAQKIINELKKRL